MSSGHQLPASDKAEVRRRLIKHAGEDAEHHFVRNARSSARFVEERDPSFNLTQFGQTLVYHIFHPLSIFLVWLVHGFHANLIFAFIPMNTRHTAGSIIYPGCFIAGLIMYYLHYASVPDQNSTALLPEVFVRVQIAYYISRQTVIAIKYAYVPPRHFQSMMNASYETAWNFQTGIMLATAWMNPAESIIRRELALACSRLQMDASRYRLTIDSRLHDVLHSSLAAVMPTRQKTGNSAFLDGKPSRFHAHGDTPALKSESSHSHSHPDLGSTSDSRTGVAQIQHGDLPHFPSKYASMLQSTAGGAERRHAGAGASDPHLRAWEKRLLKDTVTIEDMATAMLRTSAEDVAVTLGFGSFAVWTLALLFACVPYVVLAWWERLHLFDTTALHVAANVCLFVSAYYSLASLVMFLHVALADYLRRARMQFVLFQLTRSISSKLAGSGISIFKATALTEFNKGLSGDSSCPNAHRGPRGAQELEAQARGNRDLQTVIEAALPHGDDSLSVDSPEPTEAPPPVATANVRMIMTSPPPVSAAVLPLSGSNKRADQGSTSSNSAASMASKGASYSEIDSKDTVKIPLDSSVVQQAQAPLKSAPDPEGEESKQTPLAPLTAPAHEQVLHTMSWEAVVVTTPSAPGRDIHPSNATQELGETRAATGDTVGSGLHSALLGASTDHSPGRGDLAGAVHSMAPGAQAEPSQSNSSMMSASGNPAGNPRMRADSAFEHTDLSITATHTPASVSVPDSQAAFGGGHSMGMEQHPPSYSQVGVLSTSGGTSAAVSEESNSHSDAASTSVDWPVSHTSESHDTGSSRAQQHAAPSHPRRFASHTSEARGAGRLHNPQVGGQFQSPTTTFIARLGTQLGGGIFADWAAAPSAGGGGGTAGVDDAIDSAACGLPPVVDVTRPSNAFAWFKLKELLGETGVRFQLRVQLYLGVFALGTLLLDIAALVQVYSTVGGLGTRIGTDVLALAAIVHTAVLVAFVLVCILLGAYSNSQADQQAEALTRAELELEEVARDLLLEVEQRTVALAYSRQGAGGGTGVPAGLAGLPPLMFAPSSGSLPEHATAVPMPQMFRTYSNASVRSGLEGSLGGGAGGGSSGLTGALKHMSLEHLSALLTGIRSAVGTLSGVIRALRVNRDAHPVRIMGFPASYTMARVLITVLVTAGSLLAGNSLSQSVGE